MLPILGAEPPARPPAVTPDQMREVDRIMMEDLQVHRLQMVENAGRLLATLAGSMCEGLIGKRFIIMVGITGVLGSAGWFTAMTLQNAAYVRTLGQVELILTFLASHYLFRERIRKLEVIGVLLIVASIVLLLNVR